MVAVVIGVLALQGAFREHVDMLEAVRSKLRISKLEYSVCTVRTPEELSHCDALIIPGGESTTMSLVAERSGLLEPLRTFVKVKRKPTWGTCAGMILLSEEANRVKQQGQELIGGLDIRIDRNHFGRQVDSFETHLTMDFLDNDATTASPFHCIFIRAPIVAEFLSIEQLSRKLSFGSLADRVQAVKITQSSSESVEVKREVEVLAKLPEELAVGGSSGAGNAATKVVAVRQGHVFGTSFHPELTDDLRLHQYFLEKIVVPHLT